MKKNVKEVDRKLKTRLARIKGQLNGLEQMVDNNQDCLEILNQLAAIKGALSGLGVAIVSDETSCLNIKEKDKKTLNDILNRFLKVN